MRCELFFYVQWSQLRLKICERWWEGWGDSIGVLNVKFQWYTNVDRRWWSIFNAFDTTFVAVKVYSFFARAFWRYSRECLNFLVQVRQKVIDSNAALVCDNAKTKWEEAISNRKSSLLRVRTRADWILKRICKYTWQKKSVSLKCAHTLNKWSQSERKKNFGAYEFQCA
jgi:hypothetical protein